MRNIKKLDIILMFFFLLIVSMTWNCTNAAEIIDAKIDSGNGCETNEFFELTNNNVEHLWERKENVIHHEEVGHTERVLCEVNIFHCRGCGNEFDGLDEFRYHDCSSSGGSFYWTTETVYKDVWIVDSAAWDEVISEYYQCKICGYKKDYSEVDFESTIVRAMIPTSIDIHGKSGTYNVIAYCKTEDISKLNTSVDIFPEDMFTLTNGAKTITATVSQPKTSFSVYDVQNGSNGVITVMMCNGFTNEQEVKKVSTEGTIVVDDISYGTWTGIMRFIISSKEN